MKLKIKDKKKSVKKENVDRVRNATFNLLEMIVIILMTSLIVGISSGIIVYKNYDKIDQTYQPVRSTSTLNEFVETYNNILNSYVEEVDEALLLDAAINGMLNVLGDPYTSYLDEQTTIDLQEKLEGEYQGIGVEITKDETGYILIANVFKDSPAEMAGIKEGDLISKVDGNSVIDKTTTDVASTIKSKVNSSVVIEIIREEETKTIILDIKNVKITSVEGENFDGVGYIKLSAFSNTTLSQFNQALKELEDQKIKSLVLDVRNNSGGYLNVATELAEIFLEKGKTIYKLESKGKIKEVHNDITKESRDYKIAVLINGASASASEILAAALKESYGATLVGTTTYGKGTVQETNTLSTGEMLKYTTAYWLTPDGNKINNIGIKPDIQVNYNNSEEYTYEQDSQLTSAIEAVK